jgi:signal peptidase I
VQQDHATPTARALIALSLLLTPIAGYLALARWRRALAFAGCACVLFILAIAAILDPLPWAVLSIAIVAAAGFLGALVDIGHLARDTAARQRRWGLALLGALAVSAPVGAFASVEANLVETFRSPAGTMMPTLMAGDRFFVDKRGHAVRRGDVVVFRVPPRFAGAKRTLRVKRVVALAGDTVEMRDGVLLLNGKAVTGRPIGTVTIDGDPYEGFEEKADARSYRVLHEPGSSGGSFGPVTVPPGHFFMLGDNRDRNNDSRKVDAIPLEMVVGRALWIWWSRAPTGDVRWDRVGRRL